MAASFKNIIRRIEAGPAVGFALAMRLLPLRAARAFGRLCGRIACRVVPRIRRVGLANLQLAFGDALSPAEKERILKGCVENVGTVAAEFSRIHRLKGAFLEQQVILEGVEHVDRERGFVLFGAHLGNWEWMAPALVGYGFRVAEVVRPLDDPVMNRFVDRTRRSGGILTIPKEHAGAEMLRLLKEGWVVGVLADQSPMQNAVPVSFFAEPCWATIGPVMSAVRAKVPMHSIAMARRPDGRYRLILRPRFELIDTGDILQDLAVNSQRVQNEIEHLVREFPEQWLWIHRRWKPRPRLEQEWEARLERNQNKSAPAP